MQCYYVRLKENHTLKTRLEAEQVIEMEMEMLKQEDRFIEDELGSIEVYEKGTEQKCLDFIYNIKGDYLKTQFEIIKR